MHDSDGHAFLDVPIRDGKPRERGLTLLSPDAARDVATAQIRENARLSAQLKRRGITAVTAATAVTKGVVSACD